MLNTKDIRGDVGRALPIRITARDYRGIPIPLTGPASAYASVTADAKVPALFTLSSLDTLACGTIGAGHFDSVLRGRMVSANVGLPIVVSLVGDAATTPTVTNVDNSVTIHYKPGTSTVAAVEAAIGAATNADCPLVVSTPGTGATVLQSGDAFTRQLVTAVVLLEQTSYPGQYVVTFTRERTATLLPTGDDDPYLWDSSIFDADLQPYSIVSQSRLSMFGLSTVLP